MIKVLKDQRKELFPRGARVGLQDQPQRAPHTVVGSILQFKKRKRRHLYPADVSFYHSRTVQLLSEQLASFEGHKQKGQHYWLVPLQSVNFL